MKYPCQGIIKQIMKLNGGEEISSEEIDDLLMHLEVFPQCRKYLNQTGLQKLKLGDSQQSCSFEKRAMKL